MSLTCFLDHCLSTDGPQLFIGVTTLAASSLDLVGARGAS